MALYFLRTPPFFSNKGAVLTGTLMIVARLFTGRCLGRARWVGRLAFGRV
jgi:hypothetical protein